MIRQAREIAALLLAVAPKAGQHGERNQPKGDHRRDRANQRMARLDPGEESARRAKAAAGGSRAPLDVGLHGGVQLIHLR
jgi:hypothetical protein